VRYQPSQEVLERYAVLLVDFALHEGEGVRPGETVRVVCSDQVARPLFRETCRAVWRAGAHVLADYRAGAQLERDFFELASEEQLDHFPAGFWRGLYEVLDHAVHIDAPTDPRALESVPAERIMRRRQSMAPVVRYQQEKEAAGDFSWTVGIYGTEAIAREAGLTLERYWEQIIAACFLDEPDPAARWREVNAQIQEHCAFLNALAIERLHVEAEGTDLWLTLGEQRKWIGGNGRNIPSFEVFTSPDWRGTEGEVRFTEPLYVYGQRLEGVSLKFESGRVLRASARRGQELLERMIATPGADRVGEFSLTDARLSRITHFMADTLYDENVGGPYGNAHLALGMALRHCYDGDAGTVSDRDWQRLGFNDSSVHTDIVATSDRTVTAVLADGSQRVIYAGGRFQHEG
jgi:aminopeptidase